MSIRLIVTDMDGTLLDPNDRISEENLRVLLACQRSYLRLLPYLQQLQLERYDGMLIESNGVALYAPKTKQRTVFEQLTLGESKTLCHLFRSYGTEIQIYFDNGVYYYIPEALIPETATQTRNGSSPLRRSIRNGSTRSISPATQRRSLRWRKNFIASSHPLIRWCAPVRACLKLRPAPSPKALPCVIIWIRKRSEAMRSSCLATEKMTSACSTR